ncbi:hypothetical protein UF64_00220 [Thalassospira sp. HJ]|uniref:ABC transporter ATP-binding protein n=1 Tax=Thalassospira sp. HJ TaxID=1616823 RepID=UPI0005CDDF5B|nr:ATP-binding cassette domain-containing protein [Thalassospira sp. HJ]KJE37150.1 hypothetical protein UF64_00220 [Thalassospira sp. HJ]
MFQVLKKLYEILDGPERKALYAVLFIVFVIGVFEIVGIASIIPIISVMDDPQVLEDNKYLFIYKQFLLNVGIEKTSEVLAVLAITSFTMIALSTALKSVGIYLTTKFIELRRHSLSKKLLSGYLRNDYQFFINSSTSDLTKTILSEVDRIVAQLIRPIINMISYVFLLVFVLTFLFFINPLVTGLIIGVFGLLYLVLYVGIRQKIKELGEQTVSANKGRFAVTMEAFTSIKYLKFSGLEHYYTQKFEEESYRFSNSVALQFVFNQIPKHIVELVAFGGIILISIVTLISRLGAGEQAAGTIFPILGAYALSAYKLQPAIQAIFNGIVSLRYGRVALDNLFKSLSEISPDFPRAKDKSDSIKVNFNKYLQLKNLSFRYANRNVNVLDDVNLIVGANSRIGVVGKTGSGKSTLINLVLGLLHPSDGQILVDGVEITDSNMGAWRQLIGYVPQDVTLVDASIYENIAFGLGLDDIDLEFAEHCARAALVDEGLLNNSRDKNVGEGGAKLSGGQKQRIGIARALYKNPKLLVLDEATSGLDPNTEKLVLDSISKFSENLTIVMITHRYSNLEMCNEVYEMFDGKINKWSKNA